MHFSLYILRLGMAHSSSWEKIFGSEHDRSYFSRFDRKEPKGSGRKTVALIFFLLLIIGAGLLASVAIFGGDTRVSGFGERVAITSDVADAVPIGKDVAFNLEIKNNESNAIHSARLSIRSPGGVQFVKAQPAGSGQAVVDWSLGTIEPRRASTINTTWRFVGQAGETKDLLATVSYQLEGFSLLLTKTANVVVRLGEPAVRVSWDGPDKALPGDTITTTLSYENTTADTLTGLRLDLTSSKDVTAITFKPAPGRLNSWDIPTIEPRKKQNIQISWRVPDGDTPVQFSAGVGSVDAQGVVQYQHRADYSVNRGTPAAGFSLNLGEWQKTLPITLALANTQAVSLQDVLFEFTISSNGYALDGLKFDKTPASQERQENGKTVKVFTWVSAALGGGSVDPEQELRVTGSWSMPTSFQAPDGNTKPEQIFVEFKARMTATMDRDGAKTSIARETPPQTHKVTSAVQMSAVSHPQGADKELVMSIQNGSNRIENVDMTIPLLAGATWKNGGEVGAGAITYDEATRLIHWRINWLPAYVGTDKPLEARALVVRNPSGSSFGDWQLTAKDSFTGENITVTRPPRIGRVETGNP